MIRRFLTRILMVVLIAACGYNGWQVRRLEAEVGELKTRLTASTRPAGPGAARPATEWELRQAARDLKNALDSLKNALDGARSPQSQRTLRDLQAQTEHLRRQADALWREARSATGRHSP